MIFGFAKSLTTNAQILREWAYSRVGMNGYLWLVGWVIILQAFWYTDFMWRLAKDFWTSVNPHTKLQWSPYNRELSDWNAAVIPQAKSFSSNILVTYTNNLTKNNYHTFFPCPALPLFLFHSVWWLPVEASTKWWVTKACSSYLCIVRNYNLLQVFTFHTGEFSLKIF